MTISHIMTGSQKPPNSKLSPAKARRERETLERRDGILAAARDLFFEHGIHRTTVEDVAARAEVAKGTVYLYFESKETILAHLLLEGLDALEESLAEAFAESIALPAETRLRRLCAAYLDFFQNEQEYFRLMMAFDRGQFQESVTPEVYQQILTRSVKGLRWVVRVIEQGLADGDFAVSDAKTTAGMFWSAINGALVIISHPLRRELLEQEVETLYNGVMELVLKGMKK
ncbi:MAG: TetR/AcrR family transcriptional regulator [Chloroflexota bacterium]